MITFTKSYKTTDGQVFGTIEQAQLHELSKLLSPLWVTDDKGQAIAERNVNGISTHLLSNKDILIDIITTTPNSKPKARSVNGGKKNRKPTVITNAAGSIGSTVNAT